MKENIYRKWKIKYPDIFEGEQVSLRKAGDVLNVYNSLKNDLKALKALGIENYGTDIKEILDPNWLKKERKAKLDKINGKDS